MTPAQRRAHCQQIAHLGGDATVRSRGVQYMRELARAGFTAYTLAHHSGNRASARAALMASKPRTFRGRM